MSAGSELEARLVKDINAGPSGSLATWTPVPALGRIFFVANDGVNGRELWTSDGTANGTQMVADINPGLSSAFNSTNVKLYVRSDAVLFGANDSIHGYELWRSDGTSAGTSLVKDINPGAPDSLADGFLDGVLRNDILLFAANDGAIGLQTGTAASDYIQLWNGNRDMLLASLDRIHRTAATVLDALGLIHPAGEPLSISVQRSAA
jgi:ELWxxDGT repeat protein